MAVKNAIHRQNVFQNLSVGSFANVDPQNCCTFVDLVIHGQNLKIALPQFLGQPSFPAEHFNANRRAKCSARRSALPWLSTATFSALSQWVLLVALDALMDTFDASHMPLLGVRGV